MRGNGEFCYFRSNLRFKSSFLKVEDIYNKARLFADLFGRKDLGVEAKVSDLEAVKSWLDRTTMDAIFYDKRKIS